MTENETREPTRRPSRIPKGSGAMLGRFFAVGLFLALGTFAVVQSLSGFSNDDPDSQNDDLLAASEDGTGGDEDLKITPSNKTAALDVKSALANNQATKAPEISLHESRSNRSFKPATQEDNDPKSTESPFKGIAAKQPSSNPVGEKPAPRFSTSLNSPKKPQEKEPPPRIALAQNGSARDSYGVLGSDDNSQAKSGLTSESSEGSSTKSPRSIIRPIAATDVDEKPDGGSTTSGSLAERPSTFAPGSATKTQDSTSRPTTPAPSRKLKTVEANPTIDSIQNRPFATKPPTDSDPAEAFKNRPLNPISRVTSQQTRQPNTVFRTEAASQQQPANNTTPRTGFPTQPTTRSFPAPTTQSGFAGAGQRNRSTFPPINNQPVPTKQPDPIRPRSIAENTSRPSATQLPSATRRVPAVQAGYVSSKPGDRKLEGVQAPSLAIQKLSPSEIQVNQVADFTVKIKNMGRIAVDDVMIVDQVPVGAEYIDANPKPSTQNRAGELRWQLGTMKPGEERTILLQLRPTVPGEIGSVAQFYFGGRASNRTKVTQPKLKITHTCDPKILIGNRVVFDVTVENTGNGPARDVVIQEEVPGLLEFQDGSRELEYEIGDLMPGQSRQVKLELKAARVGRLRNVMYAAAKGGLQDQHTVDVEIIAPKLATTSEGPTRRFIQRKVSHRFSVANNGTAKATNLQLVAQLPSGLRFVNANNSGRYNQNSHSVIWQMSELRAGGTGSVELTTTPVEAGQQNITFDAVADLNQKSQSIQNLNVEHLIDVFFDIDDVVDPIEIGAQTRYRIRMVNQGTQAASNVQLQVDFPSGLRPTAVDSNLRNRIEGQRIMFEPITSLRPGEELNVTVQATGNSDGDHRVVVSMQADGRAKVSKEETTRVYPDR